MSIRNTEGWGVAIHGGAGAIPRDMPVERSEACRKALSRILENGVRDLSAGAAAIDVAEHLVSELEDEPLFNAGRGSVYSVEGKHELEAAIMDGSTLACGAVAGVRVVRNPIKLARCVMDRTRHVMLSGTGAEEFAAAMDLELVEPGWFDTQHRLAELDRFRAEPTAVGQEGSTVGAVVRDSAGHFSAATSTGGMTGKMAGRIGDSPLIGCGTYADAGCAVSCTGKGEEFMRHVAAHKVAMLAGSAGPGVSEAMKQVLHDMPDMVGGIIAIGRGEGPSAMFSSLGMYRGRADSNGLFETLIWGEE